MKIAFVVNNLGFFVSHRLPIAQKALESGFEVRLFTGKAGSQIIDEHAQKKIKNCNISHTKLRFHSYGSKFFDEIIGFLSLLYHLYKYSPDLIHCVSPKGIIYGGIAARFLKINSLVLAISGQGSLFIDNEKIVKKFFSNMYLILLKFILKHKKIKIIVQNNDDREFYINYLEVKKSKIKLIPGSGVDFAFYENTNNIQKENKVILPSRMLKDKGVTEFYEASKILKKKFPNWRFILVGTADYKNPSAISAQELEAWTKEGSIEWLGHYEHMKNLYLSSKIVCLPSYREGLPKVLIEAAASRCSIITTDVPGCREALLPGKSGLLVEPKNVDSLINGIETLINKPQMIREFGARGYDWALKRFHINNVIRETLLIYDELM